MTDPVYATLLDLAAGALLVSAVLIVWMRGLTAIIRALAVQGAALAAIPVISGVRQADSALIAVGVALLMLRAVILPWLLARAVGAEREGRRDAEASINATASLLVAGGLTVAALVVAQPLVALSPTVATNAAPAGIALILIAIFAMVIRRHAVGQAAGFLALDNGIAATALLLTAGVPLLVELGASLDILFAVLVFGVLTERLRRMFGDTDVSRLRELRD